jgi:capsular exopolysaccharide synthesis family protein
MQKPEILNLERRPRASAGGFEAAGFSRNLLTTLWLGRWIVLLVVALCLAGGIIYISRQTPIYVGASRIYVEKTGPRLMNESQGIMTQSNNYLGTQCELLKSSAILGLVAEMPEVRQMKTFEGVADSIGYLKAIVGAAAGAKDDLITVSCESPYPEEAAQIANCVVDGYLTYQSRHKRSTAAEVLRILQREKEKRDGELREGYKALVAFKRASVPLSYESEKGNIVTQRLVQLSDALTRAQFEALEAKISLESADASAKNPPALAELLKAQRAQGVIGELARAGDQLRQELRQAEGQLANLRRRFLDEFEPVRIAREQIAGLQRKIVEADQQLADSYVASARQQWTTLQKKEAELTRAFDEQRKAALELNAAAAEYGRLESEVRRTEKLIELLDGRIKELNVAEDAGAMNTSILEVARPIFAPVRPDRPKILFESVLLGLVLGCGLAYLRERQRLRGPEEIGAWLGLPVIGVIPHMSGRETLAQRGQRAHLLPMSEAAEAYRTVRTALYFAPAGNPIKTILVTSPGPGDGKTTAASNLAIAMAQAGRRVLLLDADFRRPMQHRVFAINGQAGLSDLVVNGSAMKDAIRKTCVDHLDIISSGTAPPNPSEVLNSRAFAQALSELAEKYDHVVIDSPPVGPVADARILAALCDATVLVLRAGRATVRNASAARDALASVGGHIFGVLVNDVSPRAARAGYYAGYGYYRDDDPGEKRRGESSDRPVGAAESAAGSIVLSRQM